MGASDVTKAINMTVVVSKLNNVALNTVGASDCRGPSQSAECNLGNPPPKASPRRGAQW